MDAHRARNPRRNTPALGKLSTTRSAHGFSAAIGDLSNAPPKKPLIIMRARLSELTGPVFGHEVCARMIMITIQHAASRSETGHVRDEDGCGIPDTLIEVVAGKRLSPLYLHPRSTFSPLDPNFTGAGRAPTDRDGYYRFVTSNRRLTLCNHPNAWHSTHPFYAVWAALHFASRHADVLSG
jgi:protocatechuate 3,4-dioxygenase beta subunit